jgi:hypothetical protein
MPTEGIEAVYLTTHNWGKAAKFFTALGYELEFDTGHQSGQLRNRTGPSVFVAEIPADQPTDIRVVLKTGTEFEPGPPVDVVTGFEDTHYGTREMTVRDPDGRLWTIQAAK